MLSWGDDAHPPFLCFTIFWSLRGQQTHLELLPCVASTARSHEQLSKWLLGTHLSLLPLTPTGKIRQRQGKQQAVSRSGEPRPNCGYGPRVGCPAIQNLPTTPCLRVILSGLPDLPIKGPTLGSGEGGEAPYGLGAWKWGQMHLDQVGAGGMCWGLWTSLPGDPESKFLPPVWPREPETMLTYLSRDHSCCPCREQHQKPL